MNVVVDTSVWSLALRRKREDLSAAERSIVAELAELIREGRARMIGPLRQELLSGVKTSSQYDRLRETIEPFTDQPADSSDYEAAAQASNDCRAKGIAVTAVDALLCAMALRHGWAIFTTDPDFASYARILAIRLHTPRT